MKAAILRHSRQGFCIKREEYIKINLRKSIVHYWYTFPYLLYLTCFLGEVRGCCCCCVVTSYVLSRYGIQTNTFSCLLSLQIHRMESQAKAVSPRLDTV